MTTNSAAKRSRATAGQLHQMVDFMLENTGLAGGKFQKLHGKVECDKKWSELAGLLNGLGGAVKSVDQWHTVWRDLKSRTSIKVRDWKKQQARTGNKPTSQEPITELERRVVAIIGSDYIEVDDVKIDEELQMRLEDGDEDFFLRSSSSTPAKAYELRCDTPETRQKAPRRGLKRKYVEDEEDEADTQAKFLEILNKQADALKMLAESKASIAESKKMMAEAIQTMGEGLSAIGNAFNNVANAINEVFSQVRS